MYPQGSPQTSARSTSPPPAEDIQAVLGRFQAWTAANHPANRGAQPPADEKAPRAAKRRSAKNKVEGLREVSYEEALQTAQPRRKASTGAVLRKAAEIPRKAAEPLPLKRESARAQTPEKQREQARCSTVEAVSADFRQALAQSIAVRVSALQPATADAIVSVARSSVLSVRFAAAEREQITARATEAGLSTSAYIRRCAIEVEQLRSQVKQLVDATRCSATAPAAAIAPVPGIWHWLRRRFLRRAPSGFVLTG
jgi:hypothetical protein